jgi:hypothetical protein
LGEVLRSGFHLTVTDEFQHCVAPILMCGACPPRHEGNHNPCR